MHDLNILGNNAKKAALLLAGYSAKQKDKGLAACAAALYDREEEILAANRQDIENAEKNGVSPAMVDRLRLTPSRIQAMAEGLDQITVLSDPVGEVLERFERPNGLLIEKVRVPIGVIGIIYESRPNVTADAFGLCFKSGNAVILRGGSDAISSNKAIAGLLRKALSDEGLCPDAIQLIEDTSREVATEFMRLNRYVDVLIPRGGAGLIRSCVENATIPCIETGTGNCHIYVDESADQDMALDIIENAKTQRLGVCNACESLLVHEAILAEFVPKLYERLTGKSVEIRAGERVFQIVGNVCGGLKQATEEDFQTEYLDAIVSLQAVKDTDEAIRHINRYSTHHSEAILTEDTENAERFLNGVDSAAVYVNASTRFTDGFEFGFGAEIGISTQKLHARGPMGLKELTSYKYKVRGSGQIRG
ncbi:MAG: glutamate-5-semialdehyde dehydrogenase [Lachnospiraceae bacterium]|nr:glutamate-5-semialdehyde dehydrogenase [Lachnospiraceae bacterium]